MHTRIGGLVVILIGLVHLIWTDPMTEFNNRGAWWRKNPYTPFKTRVLGVFLVLFGLVASIR